VIGWVDGSPVPRAGLDRRLARLCTGPRAAALPDRRSAEFRQLVRWIAQVVLTEALGAAEAARRGLPAAGSGPALDPAEALACGSIVAAAYQNSAPVRAVYAAVGAAVTVDDREVRRYWAATCAPSPARLTLRYRRDGAAPYPIGPVELGELPAALAAALRGARPGERVRVRDALGRHEATVLAVAPPRPARFAEDAPALRAHLLGVARATTVARWLERERAARVLTAAGFEHPGDPRQPDNTHRH
jgi:[acyl-carrier-protein] S-malonyltransferase